MVFIFSISAALAIITGIILLIFPKLTRLVLSLFLIAFGVAKMLGY